MSQPTYRTYTGPVHTRFGPRRMLIRTTNKERIPEIIGITLFDALEHWCVTTEERDTRITTGTHNMPFIHCSECDTWHYYHKERG